MAKDRTASGTNLTPNYHISVNTVPSVPKSDTSAFYSLNKDRQKSGLSLVTNKDTLSNIPKANTKTNVGKLIGGTVVQGADQFVKGLTSTADMLLGGAAQEVHNLLNQTADTLGYSGDKNLFGDKNYISRFNDYVHNYSKANEEYYAKNAEGSKAAQAVNTYGTQVMAAVPAALMAVMTSGLSAAGTATTEGLVAASTIGESSGAAQFANMAGNAIKQIAANPNTQLSFAQEAGNAYESALADGATESEAAVYASIYGMAASLVEVGGGDETIGGMQKLPIKVQEALKSGNKGVVLDWAKSIVGEMGEEVVQGMLERGLKSMYTDVPLYSNTNQNALINPSVMGEEAKSAAIVSSILGGGQIALSKAINGKSKAPTDTKTNEAINIADTNNVKTGVEEAPAFTPTEVPTKKNSVLDIFKKKADVNATLNPDTDLNAKKGIGRDIAHDIIAYGEVDGPVYANGKMVGRVLDEIGDTIIVGLDNYGRVEYDTNTDTFKVLSLDPTLDSWQINTDTEISPKIEPQTDAQTNPTTDTSVTESPDIAQPRQFISEPVIAPNIEGETITTIKPPVNEDITATEKQGQSHSIEGLADATGFQYEGHTYITTPEVESLNTAGARVRADMPGEINTLGNKDAWTGTDVDTAMTITGSLMADAIDSGNMDAVNAWIKVVEQHKTTSGKALQAWSKWARGGQAVVEQVVKKGATPETVAEVKQFADEYDAIANGDVNSVKDLIRQMNRKRGTGTIFKGLFDKILDKQTDYDYLKEYALRQLSAFGEDSTNKADLGQKLKTWQSIAQLGRLTTTERNIGGNASFGALDSFSQNGVGMIFDSLMSAIDGTGIHTIGFDTGLINKGALANYKAALDRSILEVAGDVNMGKTSAFGNSASRTWKMSGNVLQRVLSRAEQILSYGLNTTDAMAEARTDYGVAAGLNAINKGKVSADQTNALANNMSQYRLFKNNGVAKGISQGAHDLFNIIGVGGQGGVQMQDGQKRVTPRKGGYGLADAAGLGYPGVPANLGVKVAEYSPLNIAKALFIDPINLAKTAKEQGKTSTDYLVQRQNMAMDFARGVTGTALMAAMSALFKSGALKYYDDEDDYDVVTQNKAEGKSGTMVNLSAIERGLKGEDMTEWKPDDRVMNIAWIQPFNSLMAVSYYINKSMDSDEWDNLSGAQKAIELGKDIGVGAWQGMMDMPIMSFFKNMEDVINDNNNTSGGAEDNIGNTANAVGKIAGSTITGMVPGLLTQTAKATDKYQRDTSADTTLGAMKNTILNSLPGFRQTLPVKTDNYGQPILNDTNTYDRVMNSLARPGTISNLRQSDVSAEVERVSQAVGDTAIYPDRKAPKSVSINGEKIQLDNQAQKAYKDVMGTTVNMYYKSFQNSPEYASMDDDSRNVVYSALQSAAEQKAKAELAKVKGIEFSNDYTKYVLGDDGGATVSDKDYPAFVAAKTAFSLNNKDGAKNYDGITAVISNHDNLSDDAQKAILERDADYRKAYEYAYGRDVNGKNGDRPGVGIENLGTFMQTMDTFNNAENSGNYTAIDSLIKTVGDDNIGTALKEWNNSIKEYAMYAQGGIGSELLNKAKSSVGDVQDAEDTDSDNSRIKYKAILDMDASDADKKKLFEFSYTDDDGKTKGYLSKNWQRVYDILSKYGANAQQIYDFAIDADASSVKNEETGKYDENNKKANNVFSAYEIATELNRTNLPYATKVAIFNEFAAATGEAGRYDTGWSKDIGRNKWRKYTFSEASSYPSSYTQGKYNMALNISGNPAIPTNSSGGKFKASYGGTIVLPD